MEREVILSISSYMTQAPIFLMRIQKCITFRTQQKLSLPRLPHAGLILQTYALLESIYFSCDNVVFSQTQQNNPYLENFKYYQYLRRLLSFDSRLFVSLRGVFTFKNKFQEPTCHLGNLVCFISKILITIFHNLIMKFI